MSSGGSIKPIFSPTPQNSSAPEQIFGLPVNAVLQVKYTVQQKTSPTLYWLQRNCNSESVITSISSFTISNSARRLTKSGSLRSTRVIEDKASSENFLRKS